MRGHDGPYRCLLRIVPGPCRPRPTVPALRWNARWQAAGPVTSRTAIHPGIEQVPHRGVLQFIQKAVREEHAPRVDTGEQLVQHRREDAGRIGAGHTASVGGLCERADEIPGSPIAATRCLSIRSTHCAQTVSIPMGWTRMDREDVLVSGGMVGYLPALLRAITDPGSARVLSPGHAVEVVSAVR